MNRGIKMEILCPKCGIRGEITANCPQCHESLKWAKLCYEKSYSYYKKGYELAKERHLTQAVPYLQKAVTLNKYNIDAKNVLGLVYFELGEVGEALKIWILSIAIAKDENSAVHYLEKIRKEPKKLEMYKETVQLYNRALKYLEKKNDDMAVIRLKKAISINPQFIEARNLLALCYMYQNQYTKAREQIIKVLEIDKNNDKALNYLKHMEVEEETIEKQEPSIISSPHLNKANIQGNIQPHKVLYKGGTLGRYIFYFIFGFMCMYAIQIALIIPAKTEDLKSQLHGAIRENSNMKLQLDTVTNDSKQEMLRIEQEKGILKQENTTLQMEHTKLLQENRLMKVEKHRDYREWIAAAELLYNISGEALSEENKKLYDTYKAELYPKATEELYETGYRAYKNKQFIEASTAFEKCMMYGGSPKIMSNVMYYMGEIEEINKNIQKAIQYYQVVVEVYKGTGAEKKAMSRLKVLNPPS